MLFSYALIQFSNPIIPFRIVIHFSDFIIPLWILLFSAVSNSIIRFRIMLCSFPILLFDCTVLSCSFESYYFLSNSAVLFSNSIMPLCILLFSFQFYYSLSNYVMQFFNPVIRLYSPLMQFRILLFPFKFCCSLFQFYYVLFPILLFAFELCSSKSGTSFIWPTVPWGPVTNWFPREYNKTWRTWRSTFYGIDYERA